MNQQLEQYYDSFTHNYAVNNTRKKKIIELVGEKTEGKSILDLGCGGGHLGAIFRPKNKAYGIDISGKAAQKAKEILDDAYQMDIETDPWPQDVLNNKPDIIICGEMLEHLFDQDAFLQKLKEIIKPGAEVIFTTPNFLMWTTRIRMLFGNFGDREVLFDKSHIHLLSYLGFMKLLDKHGYVVLEENHVYHPNYLEKFKQFLRPNVFAYQSIVKTKLK